MQPSSEALLAALVAKDALHELLNRYLHGVNRLDRDTLQSCFHPEGLVRLPSRGGLTMQVHGGDPASSFLDITMEFLDTYFESAHYALGMPVTKILGDRAQCESYVSATKVMRAVGDAAKIVRLSGVRYLDKVERRDGVWKFTDRTIIVEWGVFVPMQQIDMGPFKVPPIDQEPVAKRGEADLSHAFWANFPAA